MCYKSPGPRCSNHAHADLVKKRETFAAVMDQPDKAFDAYHELKVSEKVFEATPSGMASLQKKISATDDAEERYKLEEALTEATTSRREKLNAFKQAHPKGLLEPVDINFLANTPSAEETEATARVESLTTGVNPGSENPNFEEVRALVQQHPGLYDKATREDSNLSAEEKFILAKENDDTVGVIANMEYAYAAENPEEVKEAIEVLGAQIDPDHYERHELRVEAAYQQATYFAAIHASKDGKDMDEYLEKHYPYKIVNPTALSQVIWSGNLSKRQTATFLKNMLEKGSSLEDHRKTRELMSGNLPPLPAFDTPPQPVPHRIQVADVRTVNSPGTKLSKNRAAQNRYNMAQARIDATEEGYAKLDRHARNAVAGDEPSMVKMYQDRLRRAQQYQRGWWEAKQAEDEAIRAG